MEKLNTEDGQLFVKNLASFVRTHEKALANALQLNRQNTHATHPATSTAASTSGGHVSSTPSTLAAALSFGALRFTPHHIKTAKLTLTPHHLFYLLSRFEDLSVNVGPMNVRLENIHTETSPAYVSFLNQPPRSRSDRDSIHSVSSVRSVMSGIGALWSSLGLWTKDSSKSEKAKAVLEADLKYLYSAFTKIPCLRLAPDHRARLIRGYEEFPFDTAVPLHCFKNLSALEIIDIDFRSFFGWDRISEQLRTLTLKRANIDDLADLLTGIVLDDIDKRRRRSSKSQPSPILSGSGSTNLQPVLRSDASKASSAPGSPVTDAGFITSQSLRSTPMARGASDGEKGHKRTGSISPARPTSAKQPGHRYPRGASSKLARSGSGSSNSSDTSLSLRNRSSTNLSSGFFPPSKWRFLRHLSLADNSLTYVTTAGLAPVANTLHSLDLSSNLFVEVPDSLASLVALRALNLSNCMIDSLRSLSRSPLPAITALNLRGNRLESLAGIERLLSLERLDLRDNNLSDPMEIARLTSLPEIREIWVSGNPFMRTHPNYRVVVFNLFRQTPGYSEDIIIDATGPSYGERKQLTERAAEPEAAPIVRAVEQDPPSAVTVVEPMASQDPYYSSPDPQQESQYSPGSFQSHHAAVTGRRRKVQRRRIVDHLQNDSSSAGDCSSARPVNITSNPSHVATDPFTDIQSFADTPTDSFSSNTTFERGPSGYSITEKPLNIPSSEPRHPDRGGQHLFSTLQGLEWDQNGDLYQQRLRALKHEVGSSWLTVLGDQAWDPKQKDIGVHGAGPGLGSSPTIRPDSITRTRSQIMAGGGGALE